MFFLFCNSKNCYYIFFCISVIISALIHICLSALALLLSNLVWSLLGKSYLVNSYCMICLQLIWVFFTCWALSIYVEHPFALEIIIISNQLTNLKELPFTILIAPYLTGQPAHLQKPSWQYQTLLHINAVMAPGFCSCKNALPLSCLGKAIQIPLEIFPNKKFQIKQCMRLKPVIPNPQSLKKTFCYGIVLFSYYNIFFDHLTKSYLHFIFDLVPDGAGCTLQPSYNTSKTLSRGIQG